MSHFVKELKDRIDQLVTADNSTGEELSFFEPGGNDQMVQFFYRKTTDEISELDQWSQNQLLLVSENVEGSKEQYKDLKLDKSGDFATIIVRDDKGKKILQSVIDLRDENILIAYYLGQVKAIQSFNQYLKSLPYLQTCFLSSLLLIPIAQSLEELSGVQYNFEQNPTLYLEPITLRGVYKGDLAMELFTDFVMKKMAWFNVESIQGHMVSGAEGTMSFSHDGTIRVDACRLSDFMETLSRVTEVIKERYDPLFVKHRIRMEEVGKSSILSIEGIPIELRLLDPVEKIEGLIRFFTVGCKPLGFVGTSVRISRKLWRINSVDETTGCKVMFELSNDVLRFYIRESASIAILDRIEQFLQQNVCAVLER